MTPKHSTFSRLWGWTASILSRERSSLCGSETHDCFCVLLWSSPLYSQYLWPVLRIHFAEHRKGNISYVNNNMRFPSILALPGPQPTFSFHQWLYTKAEFLTHEHNKWCISKGRGSGRHGIPSTPDDCIHCTLRLCSPAAPATSDSEHKISPGTHTLHFLPPSTEVAAAAVSFS